MSRLRGTENPLGRPFRTHSVSALVVLFRSPDKICDSLECRRRVVVEQKMPAHRDLFHLDGARAETRQIGERLVEFTVEKEARHGHAKELFDETSGIRLGNRLEGI